jgi:hypothetical protein
MPLKSLKPVASTKDDRPAPIASAGFSKETIAALAQSAKRLQEVPPRAHSKREIEQLLKKIRDRS